MQAGLVEMIFSFGVVALFLGWQYWTVRDAGKPRSPPERRRDDDQ